MNTADCMNLIVETYGRLYSMAQDQLHLLSEERFAEFFTLSSRVQGIQQQLSTLNKRLLSSLENEPAEPIKKRAKEEVSRLQGLIEEIYTSMEEIIEEKKEVVRQELIKLNKGQKALRGYRHTDKTPPRFIQKIT